MGLTFAVEHCGRVNHDLVLEQLIQVELGKQCIGAHAYAPAAGRCLGRQLLRDHDFDRFVEDPDTRYQLAPDNTLPYAEFLHRIGALKNKAASWKDYFFEDIHEEAGS